VGHMGWVHEAEIIQAAAAVQETAVRLRVTDSSPLASQIEEVVTQRT
jgi:aspartate aminotransferase-like enzyme